VFLISGLETPNAGNAGFHLSDVELIQPPHRGLKRLHEIQWTWWYPGQIVYPEPSVSPSNMDLEIHSLEMVNAPAQDRHPSTFETLDREVFDEVPD